MARPYDYLRFLYLVGFASIMPGLGVGFPGVQPMPGLVDEGAMSLPVTEIPRT